MAKKTALPVNLTGERIYDLVENAGYSLRAIASMYNIHHYTVRDRLNQYKTANNITEFKFNFNDIFCKKLGN